MKNKEYRISLSPEAAYYLEFLVENESLRKPSILVERLVMKEIKKMKTEDRPVFIKEEENAKT